MSVSFDITRFGERCWLARLGGYGDPVASGVFADGAARRLRAEPGVEEAVPAIDSLALLFRPEEISAERARALLEGALSAETVEVSDEEAPVRVLPVRYGGEDGPDFDDVCSLTGKTADEIIALHTQTEFRVAAIGFAPGFCYLGMLPEALRVSRLDRPRARVGAGAVAIAGAFTGVYPLASPGGWRIIGHTDTSLFDPNSETPFPLKAGDRVRFAVAGADEKSGPP